PDPQPDHAVRVANMALDMVSATQSFASEMGENLQLRIGIHTGPVVAGVIGTKKPFYDVWGDTVNTAARLETYGTKGKIQVTSETKRILEDHFDFEERGKVQIKGKGDLNLWYLEGHRNA
ncbi:MAG: adenylate/guanylate cyclase domain-containing protein, partial [Paracoccaceae bacterium]